MFLDQTSSLPDQKSPHIGANQPCFIIAEAGVNHNGDIDIALRMVDVALEAGADAVKFQTFSAERLVSPRAPMAQYQLAATGIGDSQLEMLQRLELSRADYRRLVGHCAEAGILFLSTPFDEQSVELLTEFGVSAFKVGSGDVTNVFLIERIASKQKPIIMSTGMATLGEIETALNVISHSGGHEVVLLHCVSSYPTTPADANLRTMQTLAAAFGKPVGYSDHTLGNEVTLAAVALGAAVIEKHFTLDHTLLGPDHRISAEPADLKNLVQGIRKVESAMGTGRKDEVLCEADVARAARRSLAAKTHIAKGETLSRANVTALRPGTGLPPAFLQYLLGRALRRDVQPNEILTLDIFE